MATVVITIADLEDGNVDIGLNAEPRPSEDTVTDAHRLGYLAMKAVLAASDPAAEEAS